MPQDGVAPVTGRIDVDEADIAARNEETLLKYRIAERKPAGPVATGFCLWCGETLEGGRRWCDADCRDRDQSTKGA